MERSNSYTSEQSQFAGLPEPSVLDLTIVQQLLFGYLMH